MEPDATIEEAEKFLQWLDPTITRWQFHAHSDDGHAIDLVGSYAQHADELSRLNAERYRLFVTPSRTEHHSESGYFYGVDSPVAIHGETDGVNGGDDLFDDWVNLPVPHAALQTGADIFSYIWRVSGLNALDGRIIGECLCLGFAYNDTFRGGIPLPGYATPYGSKNAYSWDNPYRVRVSGRRDMPVIHGIRPWMDAFPPSELLRWLKHYSPPQMAQPAGGAPRASGTTHNTSGDDEQVLAALRAAAALGIKVPSRTSSNSSAWHALKSVPELGATLSKRSGKDRVHASLIRLQLANRVRRIPGRTDGKRDVELFEVA